MPRGDAGEDWGFGAAAIDRLRKSSTDLVFSYAREGATGSQRISALITDLPQEPSPCHISDARFGGLRTEEFEDDAAIAWPGGVAGGQEVLQRQAACPFKAFADKRLGGRDVRDSEHGLNAAQRGSLFHTAMQTLWRDPRLGNSAGLHVAIATGELAKCIQDHVGLSLEKYRSEAGRWENEYLDLEEQRLCYLVMEWMMYESGRSPFDVEKVETETEIDVDGLRLNVRMDRVDKLEGDRVLIDYKTGLVKPTQWFGDRPEQPQLPLYAVRGKVKALQDIYFASLRPGEKPRFIGAVTGDASRLFPPKASVSDQGREDTAAPDREVFQNMLDGWRKTLAGLSRDFQSGVAAVDPKHYPKTCKFCAFDGLCRVAEMDRAVVDASAVSREDFE
jgi:probable DNA repair protein